MTKISDLVLKITNVPFFILFCKSLVNHTRYCIAYDLLYGSMLYAMLYGLWCIHFQNYSLFIIDLLLNVGHHEQLLCIIERHVNGVSYELFWLSVFILDVPVPSVSHNFRARTKYAFKYCRLWCWKHVLNVLK